MHKKVWILFFLVCLLQGYNYLYAQDSSSFFSMKECLDYALKNNQNVEIARYDEQLAQKKVKEVTSTGLPQANINGNFEDRLKIPQLVIPNFNQINPNASSEGGIPMGYQYNSNITGEVTQMIYDQSFWTGVKAAKVSEQYYSQNTSQISQNTAYNIGDAYYKVLLIDKQLSLLGANLSNLSKTLEITELQYNNGVAKKVDVNRLRVNQTILKSQIKQAQTSKVQALNNLKFQMGMPIDQKLALKDTVIEFNKAETEAGDPKSYYDNRMDYKLVKTSLELQKLDQVNITNGYFPKLTGFANYGYVGQGPNFGFFKTTTNEWIDYQVSSIGLRLNIPVFDGFRKSAQIQQSKLKQNQLEERLDLTEQQINTEIKNAELQYIDALQRVQAEEENVSLAEEVYEVTQLEFKEGVGTSTDVVNAEFSLRQAQNNYIKTLLDLYTARLNLEKSKGNIIEYLNSNSN